MFGALAKAVPDKVAADGAGGSTLPTFGGYSQGAAYVFSECVMGTWGATSAHDGQEGVPHMASNQSNVPIEMIEAGYPIRIERYGFVADTGGPGRYRGGLSVLREYRVLQPDTYFGVRSDKRDFPPYGLFGGQSGAPSQNFVVSGQHEQLIPTLPVAAIVLERDDIFRHTMAGGGGYGDPLQREPRLVLEDVLDGKVTAARARTAYGVVIDASRRPKVDPHATETLRGQLRRQRDAAIASEAAG